MLFWVSEYSGMECDRMNMEEHRNINKKDTEYIITEEQLIWATNSLTDNEEKNIRSRTLSDELIKERNLVLSEVVAICKNSKNTIEHRHDATYHAEARMDEVTDIIVKVSNLRDGMIKQ